MPRSVFFAEWEIESKVFVVPSCVQLAFAVSLLPSKDYYWPQGEHTLNVKPRIYQLSS